MNRKELFKNLNRICEDLDNKYYLNSGGCCYVTAVITEQLEKYNIPYTVIHYDKYSCHYAIRVSDRIINRAGYSSSEIVYDMFQSSKYMYNLYYANDWNTTYVSKEYNPIVKTTIENLFRKYGNNIRRRSTHSCSRR